MEDRLEHLIRKFIITDMADKVNDKVKEILPIKERELLKNSKTGRQEQTVRNLYYAYTTPYSDFKGAKIDFYVRLGKLKGVQKIEVKDYYQEREVNEDYGVNKAGRSRKKRRRKVNSGGKKG